MTPDGKHEITLHLPPALLEGLDNAARRLNCRRAEVIRRAVESYLDDFDDLTVASGRLGDSRDPVLDWDQVRGGLFR